MRRGFDNDLDRTLDSNDDDLLDCALEGLLGSVLDKNWVGIEVGALHIT